MNPEAEAEFARLKTCSTCGTQKAASEFYKNYGRCKVCVRKVYSRYKKSPRGKEVGRLRNLRYARSERGKETAKAYRASPQGRAGYRQSAKNWSVENPEKIMAYRVLRNAIRRGEIARPQTCCVAGCMKRPHGHHHDYSKPLDVEWLCHGHHTAFHLDARHHKSAAGAKAIEARAGVSSAP